MKIALWTYIETRPEFRSQGYGFGLSMRAEQIAVENGAQKMVGYIDKRRSAPFFEKIGHLPVNKELGYRKCEKDIDISPVFNVPEEITEVVEKKYVHVNTNIFPAQYEDSGETFVITWKKNGQLVGFTTLKICKERRDEIWPR